MLKAARKYGKAYQLGALDCTLGSCGGTLLSFAFSLLILTMSGVREVIETWHVPLDPTKNFHLALPERFLQDESRRERL